MRKDTGRGRRQQLEVCTFLNMKGSCMYLGFSENSITLAADALLRNTNKNGNGNKGPEFELLGDEVWSSARCSCSDAEECSRMFSRRTHGRRRTRLILRHLVTAQEPQGPTDIE